MPGDISEKLSETIANSKATDTTDPKEDIRGRMKECLFVSIILENLLKNERSEGAFPIRCSSAEFLECDPTLVAVHFHNLDIQEKIIQTRGKLPE
jgi:hypothetical protein